MIVSIGRSVAASLVAIVVLAATATPPVDAVPDNVRVDCDNLRLVIEKIHQQLAPTAAQVVAAYNEYVELYKAQSNLVDNFNGVSQPDAGVADGEKTRNKQEGAADYRYQSIGSILERPEMRLINENLFSVIRDEGEPGQEQLTASLERKITAALRDLGLSI